VFLPWEQLKDVGPATFQLLALGRPRNFGGNVKIHACIVYRFLLRHVSFESRDDRLYCCYSHRSVTCSCSHCIHACRTTGCSCTFLIMRAKTKAALSCQSQRLSASHFDLIVLIPTPTSINNMHLINSISNTIHHITRSSYQPVYRQHPAVEAMADGGSKSDRGELINSRRLFINKTDTDDHSHACQHPVDRRHHSCQPVRLCATTPPSRSRSQGGLQDQIISEFIVPSHISTAPADLQPSASSNPCASCTPGVQTMSPSHGGPCSELKRTFTELLAPLDTTHHSGSC
jgi:hypothetical protein